MNKLLLDLSRIIQYMNTNTKIAQIIPIVIKCISTKNQSTKHQPSLKKNEEKIQKTLLQKFHGKNPEETSKISNLIKTLVTILQSIPSIWAQLFLNQKIHSPSRKVQFGDHMYSLYQEIYKIFESNKIQQFQQFMVNQELKKLIKDRTLELVNVFKNCKKILNQKIQELNAWAQRMKYTNKYIIFKVLKELSSQCSIEIQNALSHFFTQKNDLLMKFTNWTIQKHELIQFQIEKPIQQWVVGINYQTDEQFKEKLMKYLNQINEKGDNVVYTEVEREDGKKGLLIIQKSKKGLDQKYLVFSDQFGSLAVMNLVLITLHWQSKTLSTELESVKFKGNKHIQNLLKIKQELVSEMRSAPTSVTKIDAEGIQNVGDSLGKCLANFKNYDSVNSFIKDFSKKTAISGSISYMVLKIPLLGQLLVIGGFSYSLYNILVNDYKNNKQKLSDIGKITIKTSASIGGGLIGATIGQALIPIPLVGIFVGGVIGGFLSTIGSKKTFDFLKNKKLKRMYEQLKKNIKPDGSWEYSNDILDLFGLKYQYFQKTIPLDLPLDVDRRSLWITELCFCILSYFQCKKDQIQMQNQLKNPSKDNKIIEQVKRIKQQQVTSNSRYSPDKNKSEQGKLIKTEENSQNPQIYVSNDLQKCITFFQSHNLKLRNHLQELVGLTIKLLEQ